MWSGVEVDEGTYAERDDIPAPDLTPWAGFVSTFPEARDPFQINWWMDAALLRRPVKALAPALSEADLDEICQPLDFFGMNCYHTANYNDDREANPKLYPGIGLMQPQ